MPEQSTPFDQKCRAIIEWLADRLNAIRTGRATPELVEHIQVSAYGIRQPLMHIASISIPQSQSIAIQPWDKALLPEIEHALAASSLGANPITESGTIMLRLPPLSEERRKEFVKMVREHAEEARVRMRRERDEEWRRIQEDEQQKLISEDEKFRMKGELQKRSDMWKEKIDGACQKKEQEILTV
ncbi:MAG: ribosome recycling factor [Parcubacteria group bacterium]|nr:ribosome recycling factor [Parcubacteria group bacterium]